MLSGALDLHGSPPVISFNAVPFAGYFTRCSSWSLLDNLFTLRSLSGYARGSGLPEIGVGTSSYIDHCPLDLTTTLPRGALVAADLLAQRSDAAGDGLYLLRECLVSAGLCGLPLGLLGSGSSSGVVSVGRAGGRDAHAE
jgi:hypothetical protein